MNTRETIYGALFARLSSSLTLNTSSRRVKPWTEVEPAAQPALFLEQGEQRVEHEPGRPERWLLNATVYIYVHDTSTTGPVPVLNNFIDQVQSALEAQPGEHGPSTTLGEVIMRSAITRVETDGGILGDQGVGIIDIEMLAA